MKNIVIVQHMNGPQHYIFDVPEDRKLNKDDIVLVKSIKGEVPAICVCSSFPVPEDVLSALQERYGGKTMKPVIGVAKMVRFDAEERKKEWKGRTTGRLTELVGKNGSYCWQLIATTNLRCDETCEGRGDAGCEGCPIAIAIDKLAAYEETGISPEELQEVVNLFLEFVDPDVPAELEKWMDRCVWHAQKCSELHAEIERLKKEKDELTAKIARLEADKLPY